MNKTENWIGRSVINIAMSSCFGAGLLVIGGCSPKVQIVSPDKPIEIILNVKIDQEVRVKLDKDVEDLITQNPDLF